jgi:hypothetical protein
MKWDRLRELAKELPGVVDSTSYGTAAIKVGKKLMARLKEDGKDVVFVLESVDEQVALCDANPAVYYITDHYRGHALVLTRLAALTVAEGRVRLERAWGVYSAGLVSRTPRASPRSSRARSR